MTALAIQPTIAGYPLSPNDEMYADDALQYESVGQSALNQIRAALDAAGNPDVASMLDLPCGHGRVGRVLRTEFPQADMFVSDLNLDGVKFCAKTFGATPLVSDPDFDKVNFNRTFDLIWVGSLLTHLDEDSAHAFMRFVVRHLSPTGVAVVTSHGAFAAGMARGSASAGGMIYGISVAGAYKMTQQYFDGQYGYEEYATIPGYGVSLSPVQWIYDSVSAAGGQVKMYAPHAWDNHQDVVAFQRA